MGLARYNGGILRHLCEMCGRFLASHMRVDIDESMGPSSHGNIHLSEYLYRAYGKKAVIFGDGQPWPESLCDGFVFGLLAVIEPGHRVCSNRESGRAHPDVMIAPAESGEPGGLRELKVARSGRKMLEEALAEGLSRTAGRDCDAELRARGAEPMHALAVAFDGKEVRVRAP